MNKLQKYLIRAAKELDLKITTPYHLELATDKSIDVLAFFPELGCPKGMVVIKDFEEIEDAVETLVQTGYSFSDLSYDLSTDEPYDLEEVLE